MTPTLSSPHQNPTKFGYFHTHSPLSPKEIIIKYDLSKKGVATQDITKDIDTIAYNL